MWHNREQVLAAAQTGKTHVYFSSYHNPGLAKRLETLHALMVGKTVAQVLACVVDYTQGAHGTGLPPWLTGNYAGQGLVTVHEATPTPFEHHVLSRLRGEFMYVTPFL